jgi:heme-degrading monooxygenase HmoA
MLASIALACYPSAGRDCRQIHVGKVEMYVIFWEFFVRPEKVYAFIAAYKSDGAWAQLFAQADGYLGTELLRSTDGDDGTQFLTIDRWKTAEHFARFHAEFEPHYRTLDTQCAGFTLKESKLGTFISET